MLSFDVSVIDFVLLIAVAVLTALIIAQRQAKPANKSKDFNEVQQEVARKQFQPLNKISQHTAKASRQSSSQECPHHFGFLRNLPEGSALPDECADCPKAMRCMFPNPQSKPRPLPAT